METESEYHARKRAEQRAAMLAQTKCGNEECIDLPTEPGPCAAYVDCACGWPAAGGTTHCATCQHQRACHTLAAAIDTDTRSAK